MKHWCFMAFHGGQPLSLKINTLAKSMKHDETP